MSFYKDICYFSKKGGAEVDFIVNDDYALEVKLSADKKHILNTKRISAELGLKGGFVISKKFLDEDGIILAHDL